MFFTQYLGKVLCCTHWSIFKKPKQLFSKLIYFLYPLFPDKRICFDYHSVYHWFYPLHNAKVPRIDFQWIVLTIDATHTTINKPFTDFLVFWVFFDAFDRMIRRLLWQWPKSYLHWKHQMPVAIKPLWWNLGGHIVFMITYIYYVYK